jgi:hypothetical protein
MWLGRFITVPYDGGQHGSRFVGATVLKEGAIVSEKHLGRGSWPWPASVRLLQVLQ